MLVFIKFHENLFQRSSVASLQFVFSKVIGRGNVAAILQTYRTAKKKNPLRYTVTSEKKSSKLKFIYLNDSYNLFPKKKIKKFDLHFMSGTFMIDTSQHLINSTSFFVLLISRNYIDILPGIVRECFLLFGTESFVFQFAIQKVKDQDIQNYNIACCSVWV